MNLREWERRQTINTELRLAPDTRGFCRECGSLEELTDGHCASCVGALTRQEEE